MLNTNIYIFHTQIDIKLYRFYLKKNFFYSDFLYISTHLSFYYNIYQSLLLIKQNLLVKYIYITHYNNFLILYYLSPIFFIIFILSFKFLSNNMVTKTYVKLKIYPKLHMYSNSQSNFSFYIIV